MTGTTTLSAWVERYLQEQRRLGRMNPETARKVGYRLHRLADSFGRRPLNQLNRQSIERWLMGLEHLAPGTRRLNLATVSTFCGWLAYQGAIKRDPTVGMCIAKPRGLPRALSRQQIAKVMAVLPDERARVIVVLMLYLGLRCCELSRGRAEDYDPCAATLLVTGKGGHERLLPVPEPAAAVLDAYLSRRGSAIGPLVRSRNHPARPLSPGAISRLLSVWMRQAGVKRTRFDGVSGHALRHTAASDTLAHCHDLRAVQEMLGHQDLNTTAVYLRRASLGELRQAMEGRDYSPLSVDPRG